MKRNIAKINLEIRRCEDCPFSRIQKERGGELYCVHDLKRPGLRIRDEDEEEGIPDWCPFVLQRLEKVLEAMGSVSDCSIPKKWLNQINGLQKDHPEPKLGADHAWGHANRVFLYGESFLEECVGFGLITNNEIQKLKLLLKITALLHDVGMADSLRNHEIHSAGLAERYLLSGKVDIDEEDVQAISHAICNHSKGHETRSFLDAALLIGDKLDVTKERMLRPTSPIIVELMKVEKVEYQIYGEFFYPKGAKLKYSTSGDFDVLKLREWDKAVTVPMRLTLDFLKLAEFKFFVDDDEIDVSKMF